MRSTFAASMKFLSQVEFFFNFKQTLGRNRQGWKVKIGHSVACCSVFSLPLFLCHPRTLVPDLEEGVPGAGTDCHTILGNSQAGDTIIVPS